MKIKKDDNVIIISGKDKGKEGKVLVSIPAERKVVVEGVNIAKKHFKSRFKGQKSEIIEKSMPIDVSNVALLDPKEKKPTRIGYEIKDGKKVRIAKKSGQEV